LGCYWFQNEVGKGVDDSSCFPLSHEKVLFITNIMSSAIVAAFTSIQLSDIVFCELIKCSKDLITGRAINPGIIIYAIITYFIANYAMV